MFNDKLRFFGYREFYNKRMLFSELYNLSSCMEQRVYKYYIYSRRWLKEKTCDIMWEYLNALDEEDRMLKEELLSKELFKYKT